MRKIAFLLSLLLSAQVWAAPYSMIFGINGTGLLLATKGISFYNNSVYFLAGSDDPTSVAQNAPQGSLYLRTGATSGLYIKTDAGSSTNWVLQLGGSAAATSVALIPASTTISALAIDWSTGLVFKKTLGANSTFTFSNTKDGQTIVVALTNTASNYTVTWPTVSWSGGSAPTQTIGAKTDVYTFIKIGSTIYGSVVQNF